MLSDERRMEEIERMDDKTCRHDLECIREYFMEQTGGCCPVCLDYAIALLTIRINKEEDEIYGK